MCAYTEMQTQINSQAYKRQDKSDRARRLPTKGLMNENGLLGFPAPTPIPRQSLPTRLPQTKENRLAGWLQTLGTQPGPGVPAAAPAFRTLESSRASPLGPEPSCPGSLPTGAPTHCHWYSLLPASTFIFLGNHYSFFHRQIEMFLCFA